MFTLGMNIMKQKTFTKILLATALVMVFAACSSLKQFDAKYVKVEPQPLVVKGGKVPARITLDIPAKWFHKKAEVRVTPVLRYAGGEAQGTTYTFQGEKVRGNGVTIAYKQGGKQTITSEFDYIPAMQQSDLYLTFEARIGKKTVKLPAVKVGEGVIATEQIASHKYATASIAPDMFQRIIKEKHDADIKFLIQQAGLRSGELNKAAIKEWKERVKAADKAANQNVDIEVQAYASPDGGYDLNERLAAQREKNTSSYVKRTLKQNKVDAPVNALYTAQDWEGFKTLVEQSNIQDKDLVLRVLSMYPDPEVREREIKNISSVFRQLADDILPQLRRSRLIANVEIIGKSDEELARMGRQTPDQLNVEELLYSATLFDDDATKKEIYTSATRIYPEDSRAYNNLGTLAYRAGDMKAAFEHFHKAAMVAGKAGKPNGSTLMNMALLSVGEGKLSDAEQLLGKAGNVAELSSAMGLLYVRQGKYAEAASLLADEASNNAVVAQILNNDYNKALDLLSKIKTPDATTHYLKAIIGARTAQTDLVRDGIATAVKMDPNMAKTIAQDREFAKYVGQDFFRTLVR